MNYKKAYSKLVSRAKKKRRSKGGDEYFEEHHILPKSLRKDLADHKGNLVLLTPREHYVAHKLLTKVFPGKPMLYAFMVMANKASKGGDRKGYRVTSREFDKLKKDFAKHNPAKSDTAKAKISAAKKGPNHHFYGAKSENTPGFKDDTFVFTHKDGRMLEGTRTFLFENTDLTRANVSNLITGYRYSAKGWSLKGRKKPAARKKEKANGADLQQYCWYHKPTGIGYVCNRYVFEKLSGLKKGSIRTLIHKTRNTVFGWELHS